MEHQQTGATPAQSRGRLLIAFIALYISWGSTYLAIRYGLETLPPFLMAASRFLIAGAIMYAFARTTGTPAARASSWWTALIIGAFLLLVGNGGVVLAEKTVPSGVTALLVGATPFWMVLFNWWSGGKRPRVATMLGLFVGFVGLLILVNPHSGGLAADRIDPFGAGLVLLATLSWSIGSLYSKRARSMPAPMLASAMQMLTGGALLLVTSTARGELRHFHISQVSVHSWLALTYLITFGSIIGFSCYVYVLKHASAAKASTYAYVNPVVAVVIGWAIGGEPIGIRTLIAGAAIVIAVILITTAGTKPVTAATTTTPELKEELVA
jgi:drug/metabolite transporter (DMT)-like permease